MELIEDGRSTKYSYNAINQLVFKKDILKGENGLINEEEQSYFYDRRGNLTEVYKNNQFDSLF